jgi:hypothetical protein
MGVTFVIPANQSDWIHIPIQTPVLLQGVQARLERVFVLFNASGTFYILRVACPGWAKRISVQREFQKRGEHSQGIDQTNTFTLSSPPPSIFFGVGISVHVSAGASEAPFFVSTAGADFLHNLP